MVNWMNLLNPNSDLVVSISVDAGLIKFGFVRSDFKIKFIDNSNNYNPDYSNSVLIYDVPNSDVKIIVDSTNIALFKPLPNSEKYLLEGYRTYKGNERFELGVFERCIQELVNVYVNS